MARRSKPDTRYTQNRELSWLQFNERVLAEAADESVPLFERLKFISIFAHNLDEFFMVRVGRIGDLALVTPSQADNKSGLTPEQQLSQIFQAVRTLCRRRDKLLDTLERQLRSCNICSLTPEELTGREKKQVNHYFEQLIAPILSPLVVDAHHPFPHLSNKQLNVALSLHRERQRYLGLIPIPSLLPPFLLLEGPGVRYVLTEKLILSQAHTLFDRYHVTARAIISVTRSGDLPAARADWEGFEDFHIQMKKALKKRPRLSPVRLEVQGKLEPETLSYLKDRLALTSSRIFFSTGPLRLEYVHALEEKLPQERAAALCYPPFIPCWPATLSCRERLIPQILRRDLLLYYPYHSMEPFLCLIREAAVDPHVLSIKITIYRTAPRAKLAEYLALAAENGKEVTVLVELQARFDEQNNLQWAKRLEEAGCRIMYGVEGYKVHAKLCLITRYLHGRLQHITHIGTGNYHEKTARTYADLCLLTANPTIGTDAAAFFHCLSIGELPRGQALLLTAPLTLRPTLLELIDQQITIGQDGFLFFKMNAITDRVLIDKLVQASQAGVHVLLNVRGICCLRPGIPGLTDHIRVFSLVGRFLEHARIYIFGKDNCSQIYLSSADLMTRNTQRRVEIACPVLDFAVRRQIVHYVDILCHDAKKARELRPDGSWGPLLRSQRPPLDAQQILLSELSGVEPQNKAGQEPFL